MKSYIFSFAFLLLGFLSTAQTTKNVFFIGNSYTSVNNLPFLISQMATSVGNELTYESHVPGGSTFQQHANNPEVLQTINEGIWDYVVLQQQSQMPAFPNATSTLSYAQELATTIKEANPCGNAMFYMTWGRKYGDSVNCANGVSYLCTYEGMDDKLYERYMQMTDENEAVVSPVGKVWRTIRETFPDIELYQADDSHPSYTGSMAAAYTFHTAIYKTDPTLITFNGALTSTVAQQLKQIVKEVVFDELDQWKLDVNDVTSQFAYSLNNATVSFVNQTENATQFFWDFGDGNTSTNENPVHTYSNNGTYTVQLTTDICTSPVSKIIEIETLSTDLPALVELKVYPNPTTNTLFINDLNFDNYAIFDINGKKIPLSSSRENGYIQFDTQSLPIGMYLLKVTLQNQSKVYRFIKK